MAKIASEFLQVLKSSPKETFSVIVRSVGNLQANAVKLANSGLAITQTFSLIPGFAVTGPASNIIALLDEPWVISIEADEPVHTL